MSSAQEDRQDAARNATVTSLGLTEDNPEPGIESVLHLLARALQVKTVAFTVQQDEQQVIAACHGGPLKAAPSSESFCQFALTEDEDLFVVEDASTDNRFASLPLVVDGGYRFYCGLPVHAPNGLAVGYLCVLDDNPRQLTEDDVEMLGDARGLVESSLLLRDAALRDPLTGLFNRRYFDDRFEREIRRAYRHLAPLALFLVDIDNFRAYNDLLGTQQGDVALKAVAEALRETIRRGGDLVARFSGGQFVIIMPNTNAGYAEILAERLRNAVEELNIDHPGAAGRCLTVSCGGAVAQQTRDLAAGSALVLAVAEQALFQARESGENQCMVQTIAEAFDRGDYTVV